MLRHKGFAQQKDIILKTPTVLSDLLKKPFSLLLNLIIIHIHPVFDSTIEMDEPLYDEEHVVGTEEVPPVEEYTPSTSPTPSSPRQEPVGMNNDEEHFSVCGNDAGYKF